MNSAIRLALVFAAGAAAMYYWDPAAGRRRRALVRDRGVAARHGVEDYARVKAKRVIDRMHGAAARTRAKLAPEPVDDVVLHERIRARLGRLVGHPGAISVDVHEGCVVLAGRAPDEEIEALVEAVAAMRGVASIANHLHAPASVATSTNDDATLQEARH